MSLAEIEVELESLTSEELRELALKSWTAFVKREHQAAHNECNEDDPNLLAALDEAIAEASTTATEGYSAGEVRERLQEWTTK